MNTAEHDFLASALRRVGVAGALPKNAPQPQLVDELQRQLGAVADTSRALLTTSRASPGFTSGSNLFFVDCRTATTNILTTAQANLEGLGVTAGLCIYRHGLGYKLDRAVQTYFAYTPTVGVVDGQAARAGTCSIFKFDDDRTIFQVDQDAITNLALFEFSCYPSIAPASHTVNPTGNAKAGAATPQLGTILASAISRSP